MYKEVSEEVAEVAAVPSVYKLAERGGGEALLEVLVVLGAGGLYEYVAVPGFHATQTTWPMVRLQLAFRKKFQEYKSVSVIPNFVQIE
jgi:hypothetical protein